MSARLILIGGISVSLLFILGCGDKSHDGAQSSGRTLPPVFSLGPANTTNWDVDAGPLMLVSVGDGQDSAAVVLPEATDSTIDTLQNRTPAIRGVVFDLFGRTGNVGSSVATPATATGGAKRDCAEWPAARLASAHAGWRVGFVRGSVRALPLDSIESLPGPDSAALAASLAQTAASLPISSDPTFRRLPFRVRSAYTFKMDSTQLVIADIVRALNEEANPRIEHLLLIGERLTGATGKYSVGYYNRVAGAEETMQATEILAALEIGISKRPAVVVSVESDDGTQLGLIERTAAGEWRLTWNSAYTDC